ncbi:hypothetical protein [Methanococcoides burtonii]|uniref:hypothetical protein n=1 Tax=Methanococcoides burtonii TaxID=29291 RepID=UPI0018DD5B7C|nr:hypothetical protein [Methanococcoides burtonii]
MNFLNLSSLSRAENSNILTQGLIIPRASFIKIIYSISLGSILFIPMISDSLICLMTNCGNLSISLLKVPASISYTSRKDMSEKGRCSRLSLIRAGKTGPSSSRNTNLGINSSAIYFNAFSTLNRKLQGDNQQITLV